MRSAIFVICLVSLLPMITQAQFLKREFHADNGKALPYQMLYPQDYDKSKQYPLVLFLHGAGERGDDNELQMKHGSSLFLEAKNRSEYPAIIVFPQCAKGGRWANYARNKKGKIKSKLVSNPTRSLELTIRLLEQLVKEEAVDQERIYIMGLSMGGFGTFEMLTRFPNKFAAAIPICGGGIPRIAKRFARSTSIWIFHGEADKVVPVRFSRDMYEALKKKRADVKYTEYAGVKHSSWDPAFAEPDFLPWLFSKKLQ